MKPKFICDNCEEDLKIKIEDEDNTIWIISDNIAGFSVMEHNNCPKHIVLCEECEEEAREELKENEMWSDLDMWDNLGEAKDYIEYDELKSAIEKLSKE